MTRHPPVQAEHHLVLTRLVPDARHRVRHGRCKVGVQVVVVVILDVERRGRDLARALVNVRAERALL